MSHLQWNLREEFIAAQIQRINNPDYFAFDFSCPDLDILMQEIRTPQQALTHQKSLNNFFDNLIASTDNRKSLYVRLKWLIYLNKLIDVYPESSIMFTLTQKALQVYTDKFFSLEKDFNPYENYLVKKLFKPYIQYLTKLCLIYTPGKVERPYPQKQNRPSSNLLSPVKKIQAQKKKSRSKHQNSEEIIQWYQEYNFVLQTLENFSDILRDQEQFFKSELPYLTNMRRYISRKLKQILARLKQTLLSLEQLSMTMMELDKLETKIVEFSKSSLNLFEQSESVLMTAVDDYTREDVSNFMCTPLKESLPINQQTIYFSD